jgi:hypothetical protein
MSARGSGAYNVDNVKLTANSITSYGNMMLYISGTSPASYSAAAQTTDNLSYTSSGNNTANTFGSMSFYFPNYTSSNNKSVSKDFVAENNSATVFNLGLSATTINSTAAITSLTLAPQSSSTWAQYSTFYLYGVAALGTTPAIQPYATGGDTIMTDGTYWYHAFKSSGTFTPAKGLSCDVLVVAGGGGGSMATGAGGSGAGGVIAFASQALVSGTGYTATIGAGGAGATSSGGLGGQGTNSQFASLTAAVGGGYGRTTSGGGPSTGGSGGGYNYETGTGASGTSGQGNKGGNGISSLYAGGGGGGAGAAGVDANSTNAGNGGAGTNSVTNWGALSAVLTATGTGVSGYIAGGGGGGANSKTAGTGGSGGGGNGGTDASTNGTSGTANTGSGAGANPYAATVATNGGSGLILVRYAV